MKKTLLFLLLLLLTLSFSSALAFHEHVDIDGAETLISGYRAPTETEDGSTGDEVCSVCGEIIKKATVIPAVGKQREKAKEENITPRPPVRTQAPEKVNTPVPTARPTKEPTPPPTKVPARETPAPTKAPAPAKAPEAAEPTPTPTPKKKSSKATPQPDLSGEKKNTAFDAPEEPANGGSYPAVQNTGSSGSGSSRRRSSSASQSAQTISPRDLEAYPVFSSRFPWRRLFMNPEPNIILTPAGKLIWPTPAASSPLMMLQVPDSVP